MPTYDYRCEACQHEFEQFQSITAPALKTCPKCAKPRLKRLIGTGGGLIFKGSGFYITDYRSESYKSAAEAEKKSAEAKPAASSDSGSSASTTSASKPDASQPKTKSSPAAASSASKSRRKNRSA